MSTATLDIRASRRVLADLIPGELVRDAALVLGTAGLVGASAQLSFPLPGTPIPVALTTFTVVLAGAALGPLRALASLALYLAAGAVGVPWFTDHHAGIGGPSFGYIIGYVLAAGVVGMLARRGGDRTPIRTVGTMLLGTALIYAAGVPWLMAVAHLDLVPGLRVGVVPFLLGDTVKVIAAAGVLPGAWALVHRSHR